MPVESPVKSPVISPGVEPARRLWPDEVCPSQKERTVRRIVREVGQ